MYPILSDFAGAVSGLVAAGKHNILIDLTPVTYVDSATIGCLMDLYRQVHDRRRPPQALRRPEARRDDADDDRRAELHRDPRRRAERRQELRGLAMRTIKTTTGATITLDGDLLAIMEALYQEVTAKRELERSFEDMVKEIHHLIDQMDDGERRDLPGREPVPQHRKYENDKLEAYMKKLAKK